MNTAHKGRRAEHKSRHLLEAAGYTVCRAAASKGPADLVAWNRMGTRFVSVKCGSGRASLLEKETLKLMERPINSTIEVWRWPAGAKLPIIEHL